MSHLILVIKKLMNELNKIINFDEHISFQVVDHLIILAILIERWKDSSSDDIS